MVLRFLSSKSMFPQSIPYFGTLYRQINSPKYCMKIKRYVPKKIVNKFESIFRVL